MPLYEYCCQECHNRFSTLRSMAMADAPIACPACGSERTRRALSRFSAISGGKRVAGTGSSCSSCSAGSCAGCGSKH